MVKQKASEELLQNREVVEEIKRHLWIESEKAGYDIGFENATRDWLERFSKAWMEYHLPKTKNYSKETATAQRKITTRPTRVKAKSYI